MNNNEEKAQGKLSQWQHKMVERHPLFSQLGSNFIAGAIAGIIAGVIVTWWASYAIPPNPKANIIPTSSSSSEMKIENRGYIPAYNEYKIASGSAVEYAIKAGKEYIKIEDTAQDNIKRVIVEGLPKSKVILIDFSGSNDVKIITK